jgi:MYXO-CTERM domain-containing protein
LARDRDPCIDKLEDRFVFKLETGTASDDSGAALLSMLVFQTKDPLDPSQTEPSRVGFKAYPGDNGTLEVRRPANKAGETCFAAIAQDLVGSVSGGGEREVCVKTNKPPFFDGCSFRTAGGSDSSNGGWLALMAVLVACSRRGRSAKSQTTRGD